MTTEVWLYSPEYLLEFSSIRRLAADSMGITHVIRSWRTRHLDRPVVGDYVDCDDDLVPDELTRLPDGQCVTCMTCIVRGARAAL